MYANVAESSRASTAPRLPSEIVEEVVPEEDKGIMVHEDGGSEATPPTKSDVVPEDPTDTVEAESEEPKFDQIKDEVIASSAGPLQEPNLQQIDWLDLPTVKKLDSLHTLMEWQFQNPNRLRTQMKDDDEDAQWVSIIPGSYSTISDPLI
jgi:hypothetical protein